MFKIKCPICDGEGGWYEYVLYRGSGGRPYYRCVYCTDGTISIFKWLDFKLAIWYDDHIRRPLTIGRRRLNKIWRTVKKSKK